jgi:hypothetical protein
MKNKIVAAKNFVVTHKVAIATTATAIAAVALVVRNQQVTNEFLREHNLFDEFYAQD